MDHDPTDAETTIAAIGLTSADFEELRARFTLTAQLLHAQTRFRALQDWMSRLAARTRQQLTSRRRAACSAPTGGPGKSCPSQRRLERPGRTSCRWRCGSP